VGRDPDVVVIGGGIVGAATAAFLADAGSRAVIVERDGIAAGASGRNSGVVQQPLDPVLGVLYESSLPLYRELAEESASAFSIAPRPAGLLYATLDHNVAARLTAELAVARPDLEPRLLEGAALRKLEPSLAPDVAACRLPIGFPVEPGVATRAYAAIAERRGVQVVLGSAAALRWLGDRVVGATVDGLEITAGSVVVAGGPWTPALLDPAGTWRPIRPLWGVIAELALERPPRHVIEEAEIDATIEPSGEGATEPHGPPTALLDEEVGLSFSLVTASGRSALGSTFLDDEPDPSAYVPRIVERGSAYVPEVGRARVESVRLCARPLSLDGRPLIGPVPWAGGVFVAAGHGPWGISTGPGSARLVADLVLGRVAAPPVALDPARFGEPGESVARTATASWTR
jgi:glycine/D-amino acid oxidase-like deaminating enzyme